VSFKIPHQNFLFLIKFLILAKNETLGDKKILLLEGAPTFKPQSRATYSNRVSAINKQSIRLLKSIDAWEYIESTRIKSIMQMQVWDGITDETISFNHPSFSESVACIVENDLMLEGMYKQIESLPNVHIKNESRLESCLLPRDSGANQNEIVLKTGEKFTCDLLVSYFLNAKMASIISSIFLPNMSTFSSTSLSWFLTFSITISFDCFLIPVPP
jgi:2-polyprenyl-6-methoxyphenol hydroxylase-like FAD-dependent oxidoreductase